MDAERVGEAHSRMLVTHLSQMLASHFQRISLLFMSRMTGDDKYGSQANQIKTGVREQMAIVEKLVSADSKESAAWHKIKDDEETLDSKMRLAVTFFNSGDKMQAAREWSQSRRTMGEMFTLVEKLTREEEERLEAQTRTLEYYNRMLMLLLVGLFAGITLPFTLLVFFNRALTQRMSVLLNNARQLAAGNAPRQRLTGGDELSELDNVYHDLYKSLSIMRRKERAVIENAAEIICLLDHNLRFIDINNAVRTAWDAEPSDLLGARLLEIISASERSLVSAKMQDAAQENQITRFTASISYEGRRERTTSWSVTWSKEEQSYYCVVQDITERARVEKMKSEFVAMVSHDLRTPLAAVNMAHGLLQTEPISEKAQRVLALAGENVNRLLNMVNNLLEMDKMQSGTLEIYPNMQPIDATITGSINSMQILAEKRKLKLRAQATPNLVAYFDEERIMQVLINLLANAFKFSEDNREIIVKTSSAEEKLKIEVIDQGCGIPPEKSGLIFDRFTQANETDRLKESGMGLGLSICKAIITAHGGEIGVISTPGVGSNFWFTLPTDDQTIKKMTK